MKKRICFILVFCLLVITAAGCSNGNDADDAVNQGTDTGNLPDESESKDGEEKILLAAAASLKNCMDDELIPMFEEKNPNVKVDATYDSSGKLQAQIEEGADVDVFMSAAMKQMDELDKEGLMVSNSIVQLLENKIVLIVPKDSSDKDINSFEDILKAETIAVGDPESVPAGQYAKEAFDNLSMWDDVAKKASLGTNVTEVLNWVAEGSADAGIVYETDAASNDKVSVVAEAPEGSVSKVIYPVGIVKETSKQESAKSFIEFLNSDEALSIFEKYGFTPNK